MTAQKLSPEAIETYLNGAANLAEAFLHVATNLPDELVWSQAIRKEGGGSALQQDISWHRHTYRDIVPAVCAIAVQLHSLGVKSGDKVAIFSQTRPEWSLIDLAILAVGGITVSIYPSSTWKEAGFILVDSGARVIFLENNEQAEKLVHLKSTSCPLPETEQHAAGEVNVEIQAAFTLEPLSAELEHLATPLSTMTAENLLPFDDAITKLRSLVANSKRSRGDIASLVYTSGTTGVAKGVMQAHGNHLSNVVQALYSDTFKTSGSLFLYLPLAHSFARLINYIGVLTPASLIFPSIVDRLRSRLDLAAVAHEMRESGMHFLPSVPRLFEKIKSHLEARMGSGGLQGRALQLCLWSGLKIVGSTENRLNVPLYVTPIQLLLTPLRRAIKAQLFGLTFQHAISGGSRLAPDVGRFFAALDIQIYEGYGLTETCVATHVNRPTKRKFGSVGPALPGVDTKIGDDGEILIRGPNVALGYLNRPAATAEQWDEEGWFHTGDLGDIDADGVLTITGRKKDLIVTAGGKKIAPTKIEAVLQQSPLVSHAVVYGEGRPYCVAIVTVDMHNVKAALKRSLSTSVTAADDATKEGISSDSRLSDMNQSALHDLVWESLRPLNSELASFEQIKKLLVVREDFTVENGLLTPTLKVKRNEVFKRWESEITTLYH